MYLRRKAGRPYREKCNRFWGADKQVRLKNNNTIEDLKGYMWTQGGNNVITNQDIWVLVLIILNMIKCAQLNGIHIKDIWSVGIMLRVNGVYTETNPEFVERMRNREDIMESMPDILSNPTDHLEDIIRLSKLDTELKDIPLKLEYRNAEQCLSLLEFIPNDMTLADARYCWFCVKVNEYNQGLPEKDQKSGREIIMWASNRGGVLGRNGCAETTLPSLHPPDYVEMKEDGASCSSDDECYSGDCDSPNWASCRNDCCDNSPHISNCWDGWDTPALCSAPGVRKCEPKECI